MMVGAIVLLLVLLLPIDAVAVAKASPTTNPEAGELLAAPNEAGPFAVGSTLRCLNRPLDTGGKTRPVSTVIWYPAKTESASPNGMTAVELPPARDAAPYPVFVWSHGKEHAPTASSFLAKHLASHGIIVVAPSHLGVPLKGCPIQAGSAPSTTEIDDSSQDRPRDVSHALEWLLKAPNDQETLLHRMADGARVGIGGHSRGAATALRVGHEQSRFKAVVAMAPAADDDTRSSSEDAHAPTMLMGAELDDRSLYADQLELFGLLKSADTSHWFLTLRRAGHSAFIDDCPRDQVGCGPDGLPQQRAHELIKRWTATFVLFHLSGRTQYAVMLDPRRESQEADARLLGALTPNGRN